MAEVEYILGSVSALRELYPAPELANNPVNDWRGRKVKLSDYQDVIRHYTENSVAADSFDGIQDFQVDVAEDNGVYVIKISILDSTEPESALNAWLRRFAERHALLFSPAAAYKAIAGKRLMEDLGVWNPMSGYPVNAIPEKCQWNLFPPLGLNVIGQRGILLLHYPPWQVLQQATFLEVMTMHRWNTVLKAVGVPDNELSYYRTFVDVNPVAAPGSGQSEYPNDYMPIMMASAFFHGPEERDYIRSVLELYVAPPGGGGKKYTLPILVGGSPLYDPQAPGWFRVTYKDLLPKDKNGTPEINVLQAGAFKIRPESERETPYLGANHMIAAGVTGKCTSDPSKIPDIRQYEAQDLVAASFLYQYFVDPDLDPMEAKSRACRRWFGNDEGTGVPNPPKAEDKQILCAMAQTDLFFEPKPLPHPKYTWEEAMARCATAASDGFNPCCPPIGPATGN